MRIKDKRMYLWFIPALVFFLVIYMFPIAKIVYLSFVRNIRGTVTFAGFDNFAFVGKKIVPLLTRTVVWTMGSIIPAMLLGFTAALIFQKDYFGKRLFISMSILPYAIPLVIVASVWMMMYQPNFGLLNVIMIKLGIWEKGISFLSFDKAMVSVIIARIWRAMPFAFISYYAAIRSIPVEYYEAADVDGTNSFQKLIYITIPQLVSITSTTLIVLTVWTFLVFDIIFAMTGGGPVDATNIIAVQIYKYAILKNDLSSAAVLSLISIIFLLLVTLLYWRLFNRKEETA